MLLLYTANVPGLFCLKTKRVFQSPLRLKTFLDESGRNPNKIWVDKGCNFTIMLQ